MIIQYYDARLMKTTGQKFALSSTTSFENKSSLLYSLFIGSFSYNNLLYELYCFAILPKNLI